MSVADRADRVTTTILQILAAKLRAWLDGADMATVADARTEIAAGLRDEFDDVEREARNDRRLED